MEELNVKFENIDIENQELNVEFQNIEVLPEVQLQTPVVVQTQGLPEKDAMLFIGDCAEGKRKIAKAVRNKYEGTSGTASEITEYSTFEEMSNKISQIPVEVKSGNASWQNEFQKDKDTLIKLPFFDVYNETLKAMKEFAGYEFKGVCAFELNKWSYDTDHTITLSEASAYYTSDGTFIKDNIIYKNGSQIGELDNSLYQFQDVNAENTNRFVVYFFVNERYQVPKTLHATSCLNLWCVKGTPEIILNDSYAMNGLYVLGDVPYNITNISNDSFNNAKIRNIYINNLVTLSKNSCFANNNQAKNIVLPNLENLSGENIFSSVTGSLFLKKLKKIEASYFTFGSSSNALYVDELEEFNSKSSHSYALASRYIYAPSLKLCKSGLIMPNSSNLHTIELGNPKGGDIMIIYASSNTYIKNIKIKEGFASKLNLIGCNGLERDVLLGIINNLGQLDAGQTLNLIMGTTLLNKLQDAEAQEAIENATRVKGWSIS